MAYKNAASPEKQLDTGPIDMTIGPSESRSKNTGFNMKMHKKNEKDNKSIASGLKSKRSKRSRNSMSSGGYFGGL